MKRKIAWLLLMLTVFCFPAFAHADKTDDNIRVLLTRLKLTDQIRISLDGSFTMGKMAFQRGSKVLVSAKDNHLTLYYEGISVDCGEKAVFTRHAATDQKENGFRVNDAYYLHPGSLVLTAANSQLRAVMHAPIEEYLMGVVPYEMSDSFPLEALKAQAIAARTYALRKKQASSSDYDVVDNTNDQAYYGIQWELKNGIQAVRDTKGIVGFYKNRLAECFYSASNGGQTEIVAHVWGKGDYDYLIMTDDPYDLENKQSVVKSYAVPKKIDSNEKLGVFRDSLLGGVTEQMESMGYSSEIGDIRIASVDQIRATTPMYSDSPSRLMTKLYFTLTVQGLKEGVHSSQEEDVSMFETPSATPNAVKSSVFETLPHPVYVEIPIFPLAETLAGLDINPSVSNEIITVRETDTHYHIESRRYGHGVGMSQRGAECMARDYGWTFDQILRFYYPGVAFKAVSYENSVPSPVPMSFLSTPGPAATPTPRPTLMPVLSSLKAGEYMVVVDQITENSYLNLRSEPNTLSSVLRQLYYGQKLIAEGKEGEWLKVKTDTVQGYVMEKFVSREETAPQP